MKPLDISIVIPSFNEEESIPELVEWIDQVVKAKEYQAEAIFIDDGSSDHTWKQIELANKQYPFVRGIRFAKNYGKSAALQTGFQAAKGNVVITMDADLQDSPDEIPELYELINEGGFDLISGWKKKRYDPISKTLPSKLFNKTTAVLSGIQLHDFNCGLKAYNSEVIKNIEVYGEMHRYIPVIAKKAGFGKIGEKVVEHRARKYGTTKFGLERFVFGFLDLLSIMFVTKYKKSPMHFFGTLGTLSFFTGLIMTIWVITEKFISLFFYNTPIERQITEKPAFFLALVFLIIGVQLFLAGYLAELISLNNPNRSDYTIRDEV
jgi:glycosyltransferase involved in cell wall biosynthesis